MSNIKLSAFIRVGTILYSLTQFSSLVDVLLEPDKTLKYAYGSLYYGNEYTSYLTKYSYY